MPAARGRGPRLSDAQRLAIINELSLPDGRSQVALAAIHGVTVKAVWSLWQRREIVVARCAGKTSQQLESTLRFQPARYPDIEDRLNLWLEHVRSLRVPVPPSLALVKADAIARDLGIPATVFRASWGWLSRFRRRFDVGRAMLHGEEGEVDKADPKLLDALDALAALVAEYEPAAVFNMDETGLFYKVLPRCTLLAAGEDTKKVRGRKVPKERVTAVLCANADGTIKVPVALIGKVAKPVCAHNKPWPLPYFQQAKAWLGGAVFVRWLHEVFALAVQELPFERVLLVLDKAPGHLAETTVGNIDVRFPPQLHELAPALRLGHHRGVQEEV